MNNVRAMALEDEITTLVLFGRIRWEMNMHRNIEHIQLNRKQHKKRRKIQTHQSGWLYISHENKHGPAGLEPKRSGWFDGNQAVSRCVSLGVITGAPLCPCFFLGPRWDERSTTRESGGLRACSDFAQRFPFFVYLVPALF